MNCNNRRAIVFVLALMTISSGRAAPANGEPSHEIAIADNLFRSKKWKEAAAIYQTVVSDQPNNAMAWHQLAMSRYSLEQWDAAIAAFQKSISLADDPTEMFNLACVLARKGDKASAIDSLEKAVNHPKVVVQLLNLEDPDLQTVRNDPRVRALSERIERVKFPCMFSPEAQQFDFWIGEWDCFNPNGKKGGTSVIERFAAGCGILENWTDAFGGTGKSINFYDAVQGKWFQYWMGQNGIPVRLSGTFSDGAMRFEGLRTLAHGVEAPTRLTFTKVDADTVRQLSETSVDGGKTWTINYDYKYVRKAKEPAPDNRRK